MKKILEIKNLKVGFKKGNEKSLVLKGISLDLSQGETLALVGESGCGKTLLCKSLLNILDQKAYIEGGDINRLKENLKIAMVFQDPMASLDPMASVGKQIAEAVLKQGEKNKARAKLEAIKLMEMVKIKNSENRYKDYPYMFSGGMRQRVCIAIALALKPDIILADEPTTALDENNQKEILDLLKEIQKETEISIIFITHNLAITESIAHRIAIMKSGEIVEEGLIKDVFTHPKTDYARKLLSYMEYEKGTGHSHKGNTKKEKIVQVKNLTKNFKEKVFQNLDIEINKGEILGVVGPSGIGKSTLARCIMGMEEPTSGEIKLHHKGKKKNWMQMIFQDSTSAFNPKKTIEKIISEPILIKTGKKPEKEKLIALLKQVELPTDLLDRYSYEISGGQRQRVAIARALILDPEFIIADEPISSLDIPTQAQIIHLFRKLQQERGLTIMLIAHDLAMVNHISDRIISLS